VFGFGGLVNDSSKVVKLNLFLAELFESLNVTNINITI
jgi:hypothetical protein